MAAGIGENSWVALNTILTALSASHEAWKSQLPPRLKMERSNLVACSPSLPASSARALVVLWKRVGTVGLGWIWTRCLGEAFRGLSIPRGGGIEWVESLLLGLCLREGCFRGRLPLALPDSRRPGLRLWCEIRADSSFSWASRGESRG